MNGIVDAAKDIVSIVVVGLAGFGVLMVCASAIGNDMRRSRRRRRKRAL